MSHRRPPARLALAIDNPYCHRLVRLSIGLEDATDLIVDLEQALA